jgi:hypothetical protein
VKKTPSVVPAKKRCEYDKITRNLEAPAQEESGGDDLFCAENTTGTNEMIKHSMLL